MKKRLFSVLLACCMLLTLLPVAAFAEDSTAGTPIPVNEEPAAQSISVQAGHTHCICGGNVTAGDHTQHSDVTYTAWNGTSGISYTNNTAYVYLTGNATISGHLTVDDKTLYLCLNGKTLSSNGSSKIQVKNGGHLVLCDCQGGGTFKGATKNVWGGACVYLYTSTLDMYGGKLTGGKVTGKGGGGAIALDDHQCAFNMYGGEISGNDGNKAGGAIFRTFGSGVNQPGGTFNMYGGTIKNNKAQNGGAFYSVTASTVNLEGGTISGNQATSTANNDYSGGGAIYLRGGGNLTVTGTVELTGNSSQKDGGAIFTGCRDFTISGNAKITGNTAGRRGGAICLYSDSGLDAKLNMTGGTISGNSATNDGGGVYVGKRCTLTLDGSAAFTGNKAKWGGAIYLTDNSSMTMTNGELTQNNASEQGGGVFSYSDSSSCSLSGGTIENNTAGKNGGAVYINKGNLKISGAPVVIDNTVSGKDNNVYLPAGKTLTISGAMTENASVGVTTGNTNYPVVFSNAYNESYAEYFFADDTANAHVEYNNDKKLQLVAGALVREYNVTVTVEGGGTAQASPAKAKEGELVTLAAAPNEGYHFKEWKVLSGGVTITGNGFAMPASNVSVTAIFEVHSFTAEKAEAQYLKSAATCTKKAVYYKSCTACGLTSQGTANETTFESGDVLGHDWSESSYTWTPVPDGYMCTASKKCNKCSFDVADVATVTYAVTKAPTCLNEGTGTYTATFSTEFGFPAQTKDVTLPATGHSWGDTEYTWTSTENGYDCTAKRVCQNDVTHIDTETVTAAYSIITEPSCLTAGLGRYQASFEADWAKDASRDVPLVALDHDWSAWKSTGNGTHTRVCSRDENHTETGNCTGGTATCIASAICTACGGEYGEKAPENHAEGCKLEWITTATGHEQKYSRCGKVIVTETAHTFGDWTTTKAPTSSQTGEKERSCNICQYKETQTIPATGGSGGSGSTTYTIKATAGANGSLSPSGSVSVRGGRDQAFAITPDQGYTVADVKIDGQSVGAVTAYTFENVRKAHTIEVTFAKATAFVDVPAGSYFEDAVDWAAGNGITTGTDATHFAPDGSCTRAQAVTFLWRAAGSPAPTGTAMPYVDVPAGSYYHDAVLWAVEKGITKGTSDTTFSPDATCTRAQIVTFLWRAEGRPAAGEGAPFADVAADAYYADAVLWAVAEGITKGTSDTTFSPDDDCTRAQIVTFLWRSMT